MLCLVSVNYLYLLFVDFLNYSVLFDPCPQIKNIVIDSALYKAVISLKIFFCFYLMCLLIFETFSLFKKKSSLVNISFENFYYSPV